MIFRKYSRVSLGENNERKVCSSLVVSVLNFDSLQRQLTVNSKTLSRLLGSIRVEQDVGEL